MDGGPNSFPLYQGWAKYSTIGNGLQKSSSCIWDKSGSTGSSSSNKSKLSPTFRVPCKFHSCPEFMSSHKLVSAIYSFPYHDLDSPPPSLLVCSLISLFSWIPGAQPRAWLRSLHLISSVTGSMMTIKVVTNLVDYRGRLVQASCPLLLGVLARLILVDS